MTTLIETAIWPPERVTAAMPYQMALLRLKDFIPAENYRFCIKQHV